MATGGPSGVLTFDKPRGCTSHDVVARVRRTLRTRAVGHAGTLDPMATGVLVVLVGEATKLAPWLTAHDKTYVATLALGIETDTLDADGREVRREALSAALRAALSPSDVLAPIAPLFERALELERQRISQLPPAYSAIHTEGERAYARARRGEAPVLAARAVRVLRLELVAWGERPATCSLALEVSKGYYVRSLARDLAAALGTVGHLTHLRRLTSGPFGLDPALAIDASADAMRSRLEPVASAAARALPVGHLTASGVVDARQGRRVHPTAIAAPSSGPCAWLDDQGDLVAIGELDEDRGGRVVRGFAATSRESPCAPLAEPP
jgi:tRNA pseudouridine55 synthase